MEKMGFGEVSGQNDVALKSKEKEAEGLRSYIYTV
jgi:hypothetical protein